MKKIVSVPGWNSLDFLPEIRQKLEGFYSSISHDGTHSLKHEEYVSWINFVSKVICTPSHVEGINIQVNRENQTYFYAFGALDQSEVEVKYGLARYINLVKGKGAQAPVLKRSEAYYWADLPLAPGQELKKGFFASTQIAQTMVELIRLKDLMGVDQFRLTPFRSAGSDPVSSESVLHNISILLAHLQAGDLDKVVTNVYQKYVYPGASKEDVEQLKGSQSRVFEPFGLFMVCDFKTTWMLLNILNVLKKDNLSLNLVDFLGVEEFRFNCLDDQMEDPNFIFKIRFITMGLARYPEIIRVLITAFNELYPTQDRVQAQIAQIKKMLIQRIQSATLESLKGDGIVGIEEGFQEDVQAILLMNRDEVVLKIKQLYCDNRVAQLRTLLSHLRSGSSRQFLLDYYAFSYRDFFELAPTAFVLDMAAMFKFNTVKLRRLTQQLAIDFKIGEDTERAQGFLTLAINWHWFEYRILHGIQKTAQSWVQDAYVYCQVHDMTHLYELWDQLLIRFLVYKWVKHEDRLYQTLDRSYFRFNQFKNQQGIHPNLRRAIEMFEHVLRGQRFDQVNVKDKNLEKKLVESLEQIKQGGSDEITSGVFFSWYWQDIKETQRMRRPSLEFPVSILTLLD